MLFVLLLYACHSVPLLVHPNFSAPNLSDPRVSIVHIVLPRSFGHSAAHVLQRRRVIGSVPDVFRNDSVHARNVTAHGSASLYCIRTAQAQQL